MNNAVAKPSENPEPLNMMRSLATAGRAMTQVISTMMMEPILSECRRVFIGHYPVLVGSCVAL
jgi:hypothetical protein